MVISILKRVRKERTSLSEGTSFLIQSGPRGETARLPREKEVQVRPRKEFNDSRKLSQFPRRKASCSPTALLHD